MPKNYKTYTAPGSFSEFQIKVPDQTGKIEEQTKRQVQGAQRARQFQKENEEIYLRTQRLVNSAEDASRETNFRMQTLERQSYKDALDRDYKIRMDNLDAENKANQTNLANISAFSETAFKMVGDYMQQQEEKKVAAAHDVISRTGVTYDQMLAFQKMNDNLTRSEFAAQDTIQEMFGPDADPALLDGMFAVYQNRNTRRWVEHKQLLFNTLNGFPDFMEMRINEIQNETGQIITDFDPVLAEIKREFMEANFVGTARPEVLAGAGVYAKLDELISSRRNLFLKDRRDLQEKELSQNRQDSFADVFNTERVAGLIRHNSTNPSFQKRQDLLEFLKSKAKIGGANALEIDDIDALLNYEGGGSNGKTLKESFKMWSSEVEEIKKDILKRESNEEAQFEKDRQRRFNAQVVDMMNQAGLDRDSLTAVEFTMIKQKMTTMPEYFGVSTDIFDDFSRLTVDAQRAEQTNLYNNQLWQLGRLTPETVRGGFYLNMNDFDKWDRAAKSDSQLFSEASLKSYNDRIQNLFEQSPQIRANKNAFGKYNDVTYALALAGFKRDFKKYTRQFHLANAELSHNDVRERALARVKQDIDALIQTMDGTGNIPIYGIQEFKPEEIISLEKSGVAKMNKMKNILRDETLTPAKQYENLAKEMDYAELENALTNFGSSQWRMPPAIEFIAEETNKNPLQVLEKIAPFIGKDLRLKVDALRDEQRSRYSDFQVTPYTYIRNTFRTPERTGRANVGDTKTGTSAPIRPSVFNVVQYVSGDPAIRGKSTSDRRIVYDNGDGPRGHGGKNYHNHYEFATQDEAAAAKLLFEQNGFRVTSYLRPNDEGSAHSRGVAIDVAPDPNLPYTDEAEAAWSAAANAVINFDPLANE